MKKQSEQQNNKTIRKESGYRPPAYRLRAGLSEKTEEKEQIFKIKIVPINMMEKGKEIIFKIAPASPSSERGEEVINAITIT